MREDAAMPINSLRQAGIFATVKYKIEDILHTVRTTL